MYSTTSGAVSNTPISKMAEEQTNTYVPKLPKVSLKVLLEISEKFEIFHYQDEEYLRRYTRLEQAYYYFLHNYVYQPNKKFRKCSKLEFFCYVHSQDPLNWYDEDEVTNCFTEFLKFRKRLPTHGAIILSENMEEVVMVQGGYDQFWGFPKGRIDFDEAPVDCAIREVYEEVGLDISGFIDPSSCINYSWKGAKCSMYIIKDFPKNIQLHISNRFEISNVAWVPLKYLFKNLYNQEEFPLSKICKAVTVKFKGKLRIDKLDAMMREYSM